MQTSDLTAPDVQAPQNKQRLRERGMLFFLIAASLAVAGFGVSRAYQLQAQPTVTVLGGSTYDAGAVTPHHAVVHTFRLRNPHPFFVNISAPVAGCACTTASVSSPRIAPGGWASVTLNVEPEPSSPSVSGSASITTAHGAKTCQTWLFVTASSSGR